MCITGSCCLYLSAQLVYSTQKVCRMLVCQFWPFWGVTLSDDAKAKLKVVRARPHQCPSTASPCWQYTCSSEGVLNLVATGSETAGLIRRRRRRPAIGCGLCSCQSARTLPPLASDQSVILRGIDRRYGNEEAGRRGPSVDRMSRRAAGDRFYYCRLVHSSLKIGLHAL